MHFESILRRSRGTTHVIWWWTAAALAATLPAAATAATIPAAAALATTAWTSTTRPTTSARLS
jgi:hypothetical protein